MITHITVTSAEYLLYMNWLADSWTGFALSSPDQVAAFLYVRKVGPL